MGQFMMDQDDHDYIEVVTWKFPVMDHGMWEADVMSQRWKLSLIQAQGSVF